MPPSDADLDLQGWSLDGLRKTALAYFGVGADADLPDEVRFLINVTRLLRRRLAHAGADAETKLSIFCLYPFAPTESETGYGDEVPMLDDGTTALGDHIWRVNATAANGVPLALAGANDAGAFAKVKEVGGGSVPAIIFKPEASATELRFYPAGVADASQYRSVPLSGTPIALDDVLAAVDHVHGSQLVTPDAQTTPAFTWQGTRPRSNAEKVVQHYLKVGLSSAFPACRVVAEQPGVAGRPDLEIAEVMFDGEGRVVSHALLELKVLRSVGESGRPVSEAQTKKWIKEGVGQAAMYRDEQGTQAAALCCFDMRKTVVGDECFQGVRALARRSRVTLRCWHLFATSKQYREHAMATT